MAFRDQVRSGTKVLVYHTGYGCMTGCCGHAIAIAEGFDGEYGVPEEEVIGTFTFDHVDSREPDKRLEFAKDLITRQLGPEHVADLDWEHCFWVETCDLSSDG